MTDADAAFVSRLSGLDHTACSSQLTALVTGVDAAFLPTLPGLDHTADSSLRVFLAWLRCDAGAAADRRRHGYDQVRTALSSALPWRSPK
ncbi:MAG TPA: hypothetical protein VGZ32_24220 [Actinocrinis sp.]|jgi:hypothetical protein|uniref:hypothetical protein n=1 Tax=Actinocrinis sp. TaxID=1920516 RepID=UPI002DDD454B|nr:hypothetical protein [Actinocrinis sp.]HEV3173477.1 hypothetical protein [Actinocrinis sp.]